MCKLEISDQLKNDKFRFIKIRKDTLKLPLEKEWQTKNNYKYDDPKFVEYLKDAKGYGVACGYGNLAVIDADTKEIENAVVGNLPKTYVVETGSGGFHYYYIIPDLENKIVLQIGEKENKKHYGEVQFTGSQVIGCNSLHPNGKKYKIKIKEDIATITKADLYKVLADFIPDKENIWGDGSNIPISSIAGEITGLKRRGDELQGSHPVHGSEGGTNFTINTEKNLWHCFRCNVGGDALTLVAVLEKIITCHQAKELSNDKKLFKKTLKIAKEKYGIEPSEKKNNKKDKEDKDKEQQWMDFLKGIKEFLTQEQCDFFKGWDHYPIDIRLEAIDNFANIETIRRFFRPDILDKITEDMDKDHIGDKELKQFSFLTAISSVLKEKYRNSLAVTGASSEGKTNLINTVMGRIPESFYKYWSRVTSAVLEEEISIHKLIFFNEFKDDTKKAKEIIETLKTAIEDRTEVSKKVKINGIYITKHYRSDRISGIFTTTKNSDDEELNTRYATGTVLGSPNKYLKIGKHIKGGYGDILSVIDSLKSKDTTNWVARGLSLLNTDFDGILIPYAHLIENRVDKARSNRDLKRFLNLICASAWLHQTMREVINQEGYKILVADVQDYQIAYDIGNRIYRETYTTINESTKDVVKAIQKLIANGKQINLVDTNFIGEPLLKGTWLLSNDVRTELNDMSRQTFKYKIDQMENNGFVIIYRPTGFQVTYVSLTELGDQTTSVRLHQKALSLKKPFLTLTPDKLKQKFEEMKASKEKDGEK